MPLPSSARTGSTPPPQIVSAAAQASSASAKCPPPWVALFHGSPHKDCKPVWPYGLAQALGHCFADLPSTSRFVALTPRSCCPCGFDSIVIVARGGGSILPMASSKGGVCHNPPISGNRVFQGLGQRGHTAMGWFFGFNLHLPINHQSRIMALKITGGTTDDRHPCSP